LTTRNVIDDYDKEIEVLKQIDAIVEAFLRLEYVDDEKDDVDELLHPISDIGQELPYSTEEAIWEFEGCDCPTTLDKITAIIRTEMLKRDLPDNSKKRIGLVNGSIEIGAKLFDPLGWFIEHQMVARQILRQSLLESKLHGVTSDDTLLKMKHWRDSVLNLPEIKSDASSHAFASVIETQDDYRILARGRLFEISPTQSSINRIPRKELNAILLGCESLQELSLLLTVRSIFNVYVTEENVKSVLRTSTKGVNSLITAFALSYPSGKEGQFRLLLKIWTAFRLKSLLIGFAT